MSYLHYIGIDVSQEWFDIAIFSTTGKSKRFSNDCAGFSDFLNHCRQELPESLVVLEATGGYETALIAFLLANKISVHRADPLTAKHFIKSLRLRGKTDQLDAAALARYAAERHETLPECKLKDAVQEELEVLLSRRADLVAMRVAEQTRLKHPRYKLAKKSVKAILSVLETELKIIEKSIEKIIDGSAELSSKLKIMTSVKGVGKQTAYSLLAMMPELGTLTRRQAASLAGCAPHPKDSGKASHYRSTTGGRDAVKRSMYMAAMAARNFHPELKLFYKRLRENGKKPMVALMAVMRKLITILNAKLRDNFFAQLIKT